MKIEHVYKNGYNTLPGLKKLNQEPIFLQGNQFDYLKEKQIAVNNQKVFFEHNADKETYDQICKFISNEIGVNNFKFEDIAMNVQEDLAIHKIDDEQDWLSACHICFPSGWLPEEKIGKSFKEIHVPVAGMNLDNSRKLAESMIYSGPFVRYVWSPVFEFKLNFHPKYEKKKFDKKNPTVYIKVERQITVGFKETKSALFVIRQDVIMPEEIDYKSLALACTNMNEDQKKYKGICSDFLDWLQSFI